MVIGFVGPGGCGAKSAMLVGFGETTVPDRAGYDAQRYRLSTN
jgi:hypothetical protein